MLKATPEVVQEVKPNEAAEEIIREIALKFGEWDDYKEYHFGSTWYVELPNFINRLVEEGEIEKARSLVEESFSTGWVPREVIDD